MFSAIDKCIETPDYYRFSDIQFHLGLLGFVICFAHFRFIIYICLMKFDFLNKSYALLPIRVIIFAEVFCMKSKYVPLDKQSKRQQKEYYSRQRLDWGKVNPVTKVVPNLKVYSRKKNGQRYYEHEPVSVFIFTAHLDKKTPQAKIICLRRFCIKSVDCCFFIRPQSFQGIVFQ
jgi:hypothetical protein